MHGMKFFARTLVLVFAALMISEPAGLAQGPGKPIEAPRDQVKEIAARHNLDVARWYLTKRKAYEGARDRLQEIMDSYPDFSRMDEVVFLMGEASLKLKKNDKAVEYYNGLLKAYPESEFAKRAHERLDELKADPTKK
ncbi:MAG TPA: outer membrane protein assembly factor BamD [Blastocatellia bacterium]|nr:outer membrane protein assembly factor BamD [Blastocatellia bacterium]